jgi:hypothetical protein
VLRLRLITGPVLILALLALLWGDGRMSASLQDNDLVRTAMGTADGVLLAALAVLVLAPLLARELAAMLRSAGIAEACSSTTAPRSPSRRGSASIRARSRALSG